MYVSLPSGQLENEDLFRVITISEAGTCVTLRIQEERPTSGYCILAVLLSRRAEILGETFTEEEGLCRNVLLDKDRVMFA